MSRHVVPGHAFILGGNDMFIFILIAFAGIVFSFSFFVSKFRNPYKLYLAFGKKGSGKSTFLIKMALKYQKLGYVVYTNMEDCCVRGVRWFDVSRLGDFVPVANSLLLIDEVGMIWDAREFKSFKPAVRDFFKLQRHYHVICYLASQTFDIDKKLRDLTDGMILFVNVFNVFSLGKTITRKVVLTESTSEAESRISENLSFTPFWNWKVTYIPKWIAYFDSYNAPVKPELPYRDIVAYEYQRIAKLDKKRFFARVKYRNMFVRRCRELSCNAIHNFPQKVVNAG